MFEKICESKLGRSLKVIIIDYSWRAKSNSSSRKAHLVTACAVVFTSNLIVRVTPVQDGGSFCCVARSVSGKINDYGGNDDVFHGISKYGRFLYTEWYDTTSTRSHLNNRYIFHICVLKYIRLCRIEKVKWWQNYSVITVKYALHNHLNTLRYSLL